jgi:hypothetical protein
MVGEPGDTKKRVGWHIRPFSETLKRKCQARAAEEGKFDYQWLTELLCKELGISVDSLALLDSTLESTNGEQGAIRRNTSPNVEQASAKSRQFKGAKKRGRKTKPSL